MSEIYLSILVTTYNIEACIESTINSIFSEKIRYPYEILIGDDGSSDKSIEIIKSLRNKYPELIDYFVMPREGDKKYLPIQRASRNRLNLLKHAKGKYLIYLDGDDFFTGKGYVNESIDFLENNTNFIGVCHNMNFYYPETGEVKQILTNKLEEGRISLDTYWKYLWIPAEAFLFRNTIKYESIASNNEVADVYDDNLITYNYISRGRFYYLKGEVINYRQNENGFLSQAEEYTNLVNIYSKAIQKKIKNKAYAIEVRAFMNYKFFIKNRKNLNREIYDAFIKKLGYEANTELKVWYGENRLKKLLYISKFYILSPFYYLGICFYSIKTEGVSTLIKRIGKKLSRI